MADEHRDKLIELIATWYVEAGKYDVLPIDGSAVARLMTERPQIAEPRDQYIYRPGTQTLPFWVGPRVLNRPHAITADVEIPAGGAEGVLLCQGSNVGGWSFYVKDGKLHYAHNYVGRAIYQVSAPDPLPAGRTSCASSSSPPASPISPRARAPRGGRSCTSTASSSAKTEFPVTTPMPSTPAGSPAAPTPARRSPATTRPRSPSPARSTPSPSTSPAT